MSARTFSIAAPAPSSAPRLPAGADGLTWVTAATLTAALLAGAIVTRDGTVLVIAAASTLGATLFAIRPQIGVAVFLLARPSLDLWADQTVARVGGLRVNVAAITGVLLIALAGSYVIGRWSEARKAPSIMPLILFALAAGASVGVAPSKSLGATEWLRLMTIVVLYAAAYTCARIERNPGRIAAVVLASAVVPIAVAVWQTAHGGSRTIDSLGRATGTFLHPDPFGLYLALVLCFAAPFALSRRVRSRYALWVALPIIGYALKGTYTRTAWIAVVLGLLVLGLLRYRPLLLLVPLAAVAVAVASPSTTQRFADVQQGRTSFGGPGNSLRARYDLWRQNLPKIGRDPLLGQGFGAITQDEGHHVHSDYVRSAVETGVPGFVIYVWLLVTVVTGSIRARRRADRAGDQVGTAIALGSVAAGAMFMLMSGDSNLMTQVAVAAPFWGLTAAAHAVAGDGAG